MGVEKIVIFLYCLIGILKVGLFVMKWGLVFVINLFVFLVFVLMIFICGFFVKVIFVGFGLLI